MRELLHCWSRKKHIIFMTSQKTSPFLSLFVSFVYLKGTCGCLYSLKKKQKTSAPQQSNGLLWIPSFLAKSTWKGVHQGKSRWHSYLVLFYISHVLTYLLGTVPYIFTMGYWGAWLHAVIVSSKGGGWFRHETRRKWSFLRWTFLFWEQI